ncbi:MAG TPA: class I adenylate-forming enzyme family protein, partial [Spongiibacteraceae bacterium]
MNLVMLLEMAAEAFPERVAVSAENKNYTYGQLLRAAWAAAAQFRESGCRYVALLDTSSVAVPIAIFGAAFAGIPYVPLNYRLTKPELDELLARIAPAYLIASDEYIRPLQCPAAVQSVLRPEFLQRVIDIDAVPIAPESQPEDIAIQLFTSGTTGKPKAAVLRHENLMSYILGTV